MEELDFSFGEIVFDEIFDKSETEKETFVCVETLKPPRKYNLVSPLVMISDYWDKFEENDPRVQAMFKHSENVNLCFSHLSRNDYELLCRNIRTKGSNFPIFKSNKNRYSQNF